MDEIHRASYLRGLLCANLIHNELLVRRYVSIELGNRPIVANPQLVCCSGDESLVVRDTASQYAPSCPEYDLRDDTTLELANGID